MPRDISPDEEVDIEVQAGRIMIAYETDGRLTDIAKEELRRLAKDPVIRRRIREVLIELGFSELFGPGEH